MDSSSSLPGSLVLTTFRPMASKTLSQKVIELQLQLEQSQENCRSYRSQAVAAEVEVIRLQLQIKTLQTEAAGLKEKNSQLVDRILAMLQDQELKQS